MSKYQMLHERGVILPDRDIDLIVFSVEQGSKETLQWLGVQNDSWPHLISSDDEDGRVGYAHKLRMINLPIVFLNKLANGLPLDLHRVCLYSRMPLKMRKEISLLRWLVLVGREETIHHYQNIGHPLLKTRVDPNYNYLTIGPLDEPLVEQEVEARLVVDQICLAHGELPVWQEYDQYLQASLGERYNKPVSFYRLNP